MVDEALARRMMALFEGYHGAYGSYDAGTTGNASLRSGKIEIKATAFTKRQPVTLKLWQDHLNGKTPLGIIPIRDNNTCLWGCVDIDVYDVDVVKLYADLMKERISNTVICASKSGGAHIFQFLKDPVAATGFQFWLQQAAALIGFGGSEIFPKQRSVALERGDLGSWLNMPYFGDTRWAYRHDGTVMPLDEFLDLAEKQRLPAKAVVDEKAAKKKTADTMKGSDDEFGDGPPCMQYLTTTQVKQGGRNEGLLAFGIFAKKKYPDRWADVVEEWNKLYFDPPLERAERDDIIKRLGQKDYYYPCKKQPIVTHCQSALCRTRKFGVASGTTDGLPVIGGLSVLPTDPPLWFLDVGEHRVELLTEQLINYSAFRLVCASKFFAYFDGMKQEAWGQVIAHAMREVNKIEISDDVGLGGQFVEILDDYVNNQHRGQSRDEIALGRPWLDESDPAPENHRHYFRLKDLEKFLTDANFKVYSRAHIATRIRALGGGNGQLMLKNEKNIRVWWIPALFMPKPTPAPRVVEREPI
jgi:hypothetical protein